MRFEMLAMAATAAFVFSAAASSYAADGDVRISGPHVHDNLAVYFVHGESAEGPTPLTLDEAIGLARVRVIETGDVNELKIENTGSEPVFIQSGDIVKGGKQDRVITSSFVLEPKSGEVPLAAFCVEHGRWSSRGKEEVSRFASAAEAVPSREAKLAMRAPMATASVGGARQHGARDEVSTRQAEVWKSVARMQSKLSSGVKADVAAAVSATSLQLSLENEKLKELRSVYVKALEPAGQKGADIIGYAFAVNGTLNSADVHASNGLFRKMWPKQLQSAATESIGERDGKTGPVPTVENVRAFLADAKQGSVQEAAADSKSKLEVRDSAKAVYFAASPSSGRFVHENYIAK